MLEHTAEVQSHCINICHWCWKYTAKHNTSSICIWEDYQADLIQTFLCCWGTAAIISTSLGWLASPYLLDALVFNLKVQRTISSVTAKNYLIRVKERNCLNSGFIKSGIFIAEYLSLWLAEPRLTRVRVSNDFTLHPHWNTQRFQCQWRSNFTQLLTTCSSK